MANVSYEIRTIDNEKVLFAVVRGDKGEKEFRHDPALNNSDYLEFYKGDSEKLYQNKLRALARGQQRLPKASGTIAEMLRPGQATLTLSIDASQNDIDDVYRGLLSTLAKNSDDVDKLMQQKEQLAHRLMLKAEYDGYQSGKTAPAGDMQVVANATIEQFIQALNEALPLGTYLDSTRWQEAVHIMSRQFPNVTAEGRPTRQDIVACTITATLLRG